jgi:multidrug efflux pump
LEAPRRSTITTLVSSAPPCCTRTAKSRLETPDEFRDNLIETQPDGSRVLLADVARVELGSEDYSTLTRVNRHPGSGLAVMLAPGADALETAERVNAEIERRSQSFPPGYEYSFRATARPSSGCRSRRW